MTTVRRRLEALEDADGGNAPFLALMATCAGRLRVEGIEQAPGEGAEAFHARAMAELKARHRRPVVVLDEHDMAL